MAKNKQNNTFYSTISLKNIEIKESSILNEVVDFPFEVNFNIEASQGINIENSVVVVTMTILARTPDLKIQYVKIVVANTFGVKDMLKYVKNGNVELPLDFMIKLNEISLSHTRGIVVMMLNNTKLKDLLLPLVAFEDLEIQVKTK